MTPDRPDAAVLLDLAGEVLRREFLADAPPERRLRLLMSLNAIGIAARALRDGEDRLAARQTRALAALGFGEAGAEHLAAGIRRGEWSEPEARQVLYKALRADVLDRLERANPKYAAALRAEGFPRR